MGLILAIVSAVCYGSASVFQAVAARRAPSSDAVSAKSLVGVVAQWPYILGLGLDGLGFVAQFIALRSLPIFLVQAARSAASASALRCWASRRAGRTPTSPRGRSGSG
jgi:drug/metabolite transporter (DMT)-like permease